MNVIVGFVVRCLEPRARELRPKGNVPYFFGFEKREYYDEFYCISVLPYIDILLSIVPYARTVKLLV